MFLNTIVSSEPHCQPQASVEELILKGCYAGINIVEGSILHPRSTVLHEMRLLADPDLEHALLATDQWRIQGGFVGLERTPPF